MSQNYSQNKNNNQNTQALSQQLTKTIKSFNAQKKEFETFWKFIYLGVSILSAVLLQKIYLFQTLPEFKDVKQGTIYDLLIIALPFSVCFTLFDILVHYIFDDVCLHHWLTQQRYEGSSRVKRAYTLVKWAYSLVYYAASSITSYLLLKQTSFFPTWLGGNGHPSNMYVGAPQLSQATLPIKIFYLIQFGKHFSRLFTHMFIRPQGNYYEYVLHHALSNFLIFFSYLTNMWLIGLMVLLCHDTSDFFLISCRFYKDTKFCFKPALQCMYVVAFVNWVFWRLIVFPLCCVLPPILYWSSIGRENVIGIQLQVMGIPYASMVLMMALLLVLQIFWTYYILQSFLSVNVTSKVSHNYD